MWVIQNADDQFLSITMDGRAKWKDNPNFASCFPSKDRAEAHLKTMDTDARVIEFRYS